MTGIGLKLVLPEAKNPNALVLEGLSAGLVTALVAFDLGLPVGVISLGNVSTARAAVPEAAIDEEGQALLGKEEVGLAHEPFRLDLPTSNSALDEQGTKALFGALVAPVLDGS